MRRDIALPWSIASQRFTSLLFIALYNIVFSHQSYSCTPPLLTLRSSTPPIPTSLGGHVIFIHFGKGGYQITNKMFLLLLSCHSKLRLYFTTGIYHSLQLPHPTLNLFGYCLPLVWSLITWWNLDTTRSPPRLTVFNRHPLFNNLSYVQRLTALVQYIPTPL